eukprot:gene1206-711_t
MWAAVKTGLLRWLQFNTEDQWMACAASPVDVFGKPVKVPTRRRRRARYAALRSQLRDADRRMLAARLGAARPTCGAADVQTPVADCRRCGKWLHLRQTCAGITFAAHRKLRHPWWCPACVGEHGQPVGDRSVVPAAPDSGDDGDSEASEDSGGFWVDLPAELQKVEPVEPAQCEACFSVLARNFIKAALASVDLEFKYTPVNPTLERQRAGLLCEPHAAPSESPIGALKRGAQRNMRAEEIHLRAILNGGLYAGNVPEAWLQRIPASAVAHLRRLVRSDMAQTGARAARRVSNATRDRPACAAPAAAARVHAAQPVAPVQEPNEGTDGSGVEDSVTAGDVTPPPSQGDSEPVAAAAAAAAPPGMAAGRRRRGAAAAAPLSGA